LPFLFERLFAPSELTPHGFCLLWEPGLIWTHAVSDAVIGLAYFSIPLALVYFMRRRRDLEYGWLVGLFALFILACGTTHFISILTLWKPYYVLDGAIKLITAIASVATAILLWPLLPRLLAIPSPGRLRTLNDELHRQIEERDRADAQLRDRDEQLRQAQKMEAVGRLTGGIAHDFNNMLTIVTGSLDLLRRRLGANAAGVLPLVESASGAAHRAATLTMRLLAFARQQPLAPRPIDVNRLVGATSELLQRTIGERYRLDTRLAGGLWQAKLDGNQLENALLNLAVNARDAMPEGGDLIIETANVALDGSMPVKGAETAPGGGFVLISVADTGTGMTPEVLAQAFDPFFTTKPAGEGTGLGLSQVFGFVTQSGGHIDIQSAPGQGTTVRMLFPRWTGIVAAVEEAAVPAASSVQGGGELVLVVEDDPGVRMFSCECLEELGYSIVEAGDVASALDMLRSRNDIRLVFTDFALPDRTGHDLAMEAARNWPGLPVVIASGYPRDGRIAPGANFLAKPFTVDQLAAVVRRALRQGAAPPQTL
jgi:signal transduction histidine kinase/ActR/RegA family two-component response regulator